MIRITKQADYGIILMMQMARQPEAVLSTPDLAETTELPGPMVGKILKALTRAGLLASKRGAQGGYSLIREPAQISLAEMIVALDGPISMTECLDDRCSCIREGSCPSRSHWHWINNALQQALQGVSLLDLLNPAPPAFSPSAFAPSTLLPSQLLAQPPVPER